MNELWKVIVLGIVEGITEFLPVSSTGHLIVVADLIDFEGSIGGTFEIFIQLGATLAVVVYFFRDLLDQAKRLPTDRTVQRFWLNILIAFLPAAIIGFLIHDWIKEVLFSPLVVAVALVLGGVILILVDRVEREGAISDLFAVPPKKALAIGIAQVAALIPGTSRSGATIVGGLLSGLDRKTATEFSFYLAIPTLGGATVFELLTSLDQIGRDDALNLIVGAIVSFVVALVVIGWLLRYVQTHSFLLFGIYRIIAGATILAWWQWIA
ncbi:MAG: undecaprenyl-diphosphate phosphatase [Chloroflexota bacterium]|nr:undecaprenyl-diphosphate phosphatase [Chloroflexota bacterium]